MILQSLKLVHFKNYESAEFRFEGRHISIAGKNGSGKTNLLDALHHLSFGRSAFHKQDSFQIQHGESFYRLDAQLNEEERNNRFELIYSLEDKKKLIWNGSRPDRLSDHVGRIPLVLILPDEPFQMNESSEWRRSFFDNCLSQTFPGYLHHLSEYKKALARRNASLVYFHQRQQVDFSLLEALDHQLNLHSAAIHETRKSHLPNLSAALLEAYGFISDSSEAVKLNRKSELDELEMEEILRRNQRRDLEAQRTTGGLHKDDYQFEMDNHLLKKVGSQGQQKSYLLALKLAQYQFIRNQTGKKPWLLLDDIFDKLDDRRIGKLLEIIQDPEMGQVFLTDARPERSRYLTGETFQHINL